MISIKWVRDSFINEKEKVLTIILNNSIYYKENGDKSSMWIREKYRKKLDLIPNVKKYY